MKHLLFTTIAAVLVVGCAATQSPEELIRLLRIASIDGNIEAAKQAVANGADLNAKGKVEYSPLNIAAYWGRKEIVELLIAEGADVNAKTNWDGRTPLHFAVENGHKEITELLIANGVDVNARKDDAKTPLDWAIGHNHLELADLLSKHGGKTAEELKAKAK